MKKLVGATVLALATIMNGCSTIEDGANGAYKGAQDDIHAAQKIFNGIKNPFANQNKQYEPLTEAQQGLLEDYLVILGTLKKENADGGDFGASMVNATVAAIEQCMQGNKNAVPKDIQRAVQFINDLKKDAPIKNPLSDHHDKATIDKIKRSIYNERIFELIQNIVNIRGLNRLGPEKVCEASLSQAIKPK